MPSIREAYPHQQHRPIRVVQFGEGNFLRAFVDWMLDIANEQGLFDGSVAIVKAIDAGDLKPFREQDNRYTVILRGKENGRVVNTSRVVTSISRVLDCREDYEDYMALARLDTLEFVVSNTTEAGIVLDESDCFEGLPRTYPGKLTQFLYARYTAFDGAADKGLIVLPVELIEDNGKKLKACVLALAAAWNLPTGFTAWVEEACTFCSTLVDRIVTGYPHQEVETLWQQLGYEDRLLDVGEPFALWVIESDRDIRDRLPLDRLGLPVVFTDNQRPFRERKVRVLNGAHTASVLMGWLYGLDIVRDCMADPLMGTFVRRVVQREIAPLVPLPADEVAAFADSVFERFENPFIDHSLLAISLNSVSKWKTRVLPSFKDHLAVHHTLPPLMTFSFSALLAFYRWADRQADGLHATRADGTAYTVRDDAHVLDFFAENSGKPTADYVAAVASNTAFWGEDLTASDGFCGAVTTWLEAIIRDPAAALAAVLEDNG